MPKMKLLRLSLVVFLQIYVDLSEAKGSVVIIGAGAAGIAAGSKLLEHGFKNLTILEAEGRIGGRVNSVFFGDAFVDLGAQWCHGKENNIVYDMVKELGVLRQTQFASKVYHSSNRNFDEKFGKELMEIFHELYAPDGHRNMQEGMNLGQVCIQEYNKIISKKYHQSKKKLGLAKSSEELFQHIVLAEEGSFSWFEPSAQSDYTSCGDKIDYNWNGYGFKTALDVLQHKNFTSHLLLNKEVISIYTFSNASLVFCSDGTVLKTNHVIFTPSIGVLKHNYQKMFQPALPKNKINSIKSIGFDGVLKIVMRFKHRWWNDEFKGCKLLWSKKDRKDLASNSSIFWTTQVYEIIPAERNSKVLFAWVTGKFVPKIEQLNNETVVKGITYVLTKFLSHKYDVTAPEEILKTSWYSNSHFRGTYSFQTVKARKQNFKVAKELAKPILNKDGFPLIQFAGEASHPYYYSTVHGAIETGFREADRLINFYQ